MIDTTDRPGDAAGVRHVTEAGHVLRLRTVPWRPAPPTTPDRLGDGPLLSAITEAIAAARMRPRLRAHLRQMLADELTEMKAEMLAASPATPEEILIAAHVASDPHDCQGERIVGEHTHPGPSA